MNQLIFDRSTGNLGPNAFARIQTTQLIHAILPAPKIKFNGGEKPPTTVAPGTEARDYAPVKLWAHQTGVNALSIDRFDGKILLSGGADASIKVWDLDQIPTGASEYTFRPTGMVPRSASAHQYGITHLSFYPFDSAAFLSSSYDHHLKLYSTETLQLSADFDLDSVVYSHAISPIAQHLLVACATQHPAVRLVDLRSGASTHSLAGHHGAILSVAWHPNVEHILASGCVDGTIRVWDVRKSSGAVGLLDLEDAIGMTTTHGMAGGRSRASAKAHTGAVNGLTWTDNGNYIISAAHDERIRVWNAATGANTLASFGPTIKNGHLSSLPIVVSPTALTPPMKELLFFPNEKEILVFELHEGRLLKRLKVPGPTVAAVRSRTGERNIRNRITAMAWREPVDGIYSAHSDGQIRAWIPRTEEDIRMDREEEEEGKTHDEDEGGKRKRNVLDDVFRDLTRQKISFG
ncbi:putative dna excision repair protein ercc-8 protein [Botrytis fragariae]|uniref:Putative dna excision repair protein ercc-8 protein n=1 Tax=Botrytis fragariae TaxID=1964551 RepID=A0A8H6ASP2_9HELO|nr:putative dna excision repair protein ercc-8 protein [Botrytis fragariae]KAF5872848.1 putative dna excision repair protein ercc-8 protein [Botrytis fragariae]